MLSALNLEMRSRMGDSTSSKRFNKRGAANDQNQLKGNICSQIIRFWSTCIIPMRITLQSVLISLLHLDRIWLTNNCRRQLPKPSVQMVTIEVYTLIVSTRIYSVSVWLSTFYTYSHNVCVCSVRIIEIKFHFALQWFLFHSVSLPQCSLINLLQAKMNCFYSFEPPGHANVLKWWTRQKENAYS